MEVKVLGSVSPYCKENNNCPGFLITLNNKILLDCGNGVTRLLNMAEDLPFLTVIISHLHRDHYADIFSLAYASFVYHKLGVLKKKIKVYIPKLTNSDSLSLFDYNLLINLGPESYLDIVTYQKDSQIKIDDTTISFSYNPHNITSYSIKVNDNNNSIVYSGDTGYIGNTLEHFAVKSSLLICESTFLKGQDKGKNDYHLYAYEAAKIARVAKPNHLLLTHFWPEIDKKLYLAEAKNIYKSTDVAEEGMVLKLTP